MRRALTLLLLLVAVASCSRPSSYRKFIPREKAQYGDTYTYTLDLSDSASVYEFSFVTIIEREAFRHFASDDLEVTMKWVSPSNVVFSDKVTVSVAEAVDSSYFMRELITPYDMPAPGGDYGDWRLIAHVTGNPEHLRGLGIICDRKDGTR